MKNNKNKQEQIYMVGVFAISLKALISFSSLLPHNGLIGIVNIILEAVFMGCLLIKVLYQKYSKASFMGIVIIGLCCAITYSKVKYYYLISSFLCLVAVYEVDVKKVCNMLYKLNRVFLSIHVIFYWAIYILNPGAIKYSFRSGTGARRHFFLMGHANVFSMYITWTCLAYIYSHFDKLTRKKMLFIWLINLLFYLFTDSNTGIIVSTFVMFFIFLQKNGVEILNRAIHLLAKYGFLACTIIFPLSTALYKYYNGLLIDIFRFLDNAFTGRLVFGAYAYDKFGWTLFGKGISFSGKEYWKGYWFDSLGCDNTYIWMFVSYGFIYMLLLSIGFIVISNKTSNIEKILILAYIFYGIMESYIINAVFCFPMLFAGKYILDRRGDYLGVKDKEGSDGMVGCW